MLSFTRVAGSVAVFVGLSLALPASAAEPESCPGLIASRNTLFSRAALRQDEIGLTFIGHATFLLETPQGVRIATDYNDGTRPPVMPDVATMNKAHSTHFSYRPDPAIKHVLRGWNPAGGPAIHDLTVQDVRIRNVSTHIRSSGGATEYDGNSIFVFETAQLCIAHLGHLHHTLTPEHLKKLGRIDVLLVPVDGGYTLETFDMMEVLRAVNAPLMIPMHFFGSSTLNRFLASARAYFPVEFSDTAAIILSRATLPKNPKILVLPGH
ncbi:MBL fold metallo-hydrolase [Microvirga sp. VF16]|uniref:MBL fold metallo-hydrolase n=1 Tax=Microvirga sp. VF16 TaxID=2807101 RepID=UPI00193E72F2|nr:MBL fold metallo-hydrolase [Microvirga sp. VF16]QRM34414.1 MBL fold metallo-hydrolase [Microvirga sp. VF16]